MKESPLQELERAFHELRAMPSSSREVRLQEIARTSPSQAEELALLLQAHDRSALVDQAPMAERHNAAVDVRTGDTIGGCVLEEVIGSGGMGTVWRARQIHPEREVAVKVIRSGPAARADHRRLVREAGIMASLQHPGIARIYDAGEAETPSGRLPYYTMEVIDGVPLDRHCADQKLGLGPKLQLLATVCDAVTHANARGFVHRDLKPANILVTDDGSPKILDFGVARAVPTEDRVETLLTGAGQLVGTLAYMSPEQTLTNPSSVDQRADVYALGVMLYELVSGRLPLPVLGRPPLQALEVIRDQEPAPLGTLDRRWRGDLTVIQVKALQKDPRQRYARASDLADDLRSFLAHRPISARPPRVSYRVRKLLRRHKLFSVAASLVVVSLVTILLVALHGKRQAEDAAREARAALTRYHGIVGFLDESLAAVDPVLSGRRHVTLESYVDEVARGLTSRFPNDEEARTVLQTTVGRAYTRVERYDDARLHLRAALTSRRRSLNPDHALIAQTLFLLARNDASARDLDAAREHLDDALDVLSRTGADTTDLRRQCWTLAGYVAFLDSDVRRARESLRRARGVAEKVTWDQVWIEAKVDIIQGDFARGIDRMQASATTLSQLLGPDHPRLAELTMEIAECELNAGRLEASEKTARRALGMLEARFGSPFAVVFRNHGTLGRILVEQNRVPEAEAHLRKVLARHAELGHPESFTTSTKLALASVLIRGGASKEAQGLVTGSLHRLRRDFPQGNHILASALLLAAREAMTRRDPTTALAHARASWAMALKYPVADIDLRAGTELARLQQATRDRKGAITVMRRVCALSSRRLGESDVRTLGYRVILGCFLHDDDRMEEAVATLGILDQLAAADRGPHAFTVALGRRSLGGALLALGEFEQAEAELLSALDLSEAQGPRGRSLAREVGRFLVKLYGELEDQPKRRAIRRRLAKLR